MAAIVALARAKINLTLHVVGRRSGGYHLLDSLVVFAALGDRIEAAPSSALALSVDGPFAHGLEAGEGNLVLRAARALAAEAGVAAGAALRLEKRLPVASGIGGGSSDAAATLRALGALWGLEPAPETLDRLALGLGADVPVCLRQPAPQRMQGVGERLAPAPPLPEAWLALVNPGVATPTAEVFHALAAPQAGLGPAPEPPAAGWSDLGALAGWLGAARNDLEPAAIGLRPVIADVLAALRGATGCRLARMSGSGATCVGLFATRAEAEAAAVVIGRAEPRWWTAAAAMERGG